MAIELQVEASEANRPWLSRYSMSSSGHLAEAPDRPLTAKSGRSVLAATDPKQDAHICCKQKVQWSNGGLTLRRTDGVEG